jgi:hypothetical protein
MWNKEDLKKYQVLGSSIQSTLGGFGSFTLLASKFLLEEGLGTPDETMMAQLNPDQWYPLDKWVRLFDRIHAEFGNFTLRQVGMHIPKHVDYPPHIMDIPGAIKFLDVGYHLQHSINGQPMFNPQTGEMTEGIGHYKVVGAPTPTKISCEVDSPYPCPFDEGLITAFAQKFKPSAALTHDKAGCRSRGGASCTYHITWK